MDENYPFQSIEKKWQNFWDDNGVFETDLATAENP